MGAKMGALAGSLLEYFTHPAKSIAINLTINNVMLRTKIE